MIGVCKTNAYNVFVPNWMRCAMRCRDTGSTVPSDDDCVAGFGQVPVFFTQ